ncbi:MAG: hypothetical protein J0I20_35320 [Chloroflexi bacterium]|nr:hypothetical protein [Chloroflexota bacterium]OJV88471.1 MAG: hypothetical protein BGO39_17655 [Chloroflexi bacterium 54-19]
MFRTVEIGGWLLEVDKERTAETYQKLSKIECSCRYCLNYVKAYEYFPPTIKAFFEQFGIDPRKDAEVYTFQDDGDPIYDYYGFYHFVGRILRLPDSNIYSPETPVRDIAAIQIFEDFRVSFNTENALVPKDFPRPTVQLEFERLALPWLFDLPANELFKKFHPEKNKTE